MKRSVKAALCSAFLFPGIGQFVVKKQLLGTLFLVGSIVTLALLFLDLWIRLQKVALDITQQMTANNLPINTQTISEAMEKKLSDGSLNIWTLPPPDSGYSLSAYALLGYLICYIASIIHAYREGRTMDAGEPQ